MANNKRENKYIYNLHILQQLSPSNLLNVIIHWWRWYRVCVWDEADVLLIIFLHDGHNNAKDSCHRAPWIIRRGALLIAPHVRVQIINYLVVLPYYLLICGLPANIVLCIVLNTAMVVQYTEGWRHTRTENMRFTCYLSQQSDDYT